MQMTLKDEINKFIDSTRPKSRNKNEQKALTSENA